MTLLTSHLVLPEPAVQRSAKATYEPPAVVRLGSLQTVLAGTGSTAIDCPTPGDNQIGENGPAC
jgi:hypothetical protein